MVKKKRGANDSPEAKFLIGIVGFFILYVIAQAFLYSGTMMHESTEAGAFSFWLLVIFFIGSKTFAFGKYFGDRVFD